MFIVAIPLFKASINRVELFVQWVWLSYWGFDRIVMAMLTMKSFEGADERKWAGSHFKVTESPPLINKLLSDFLTIALS